MKTCKTLTLCLVAIFCLVLFAAPKAEAAISGYYTYSVSSGKATITDVDTSISGVVTIPTTLGGYPVTSIAYSAFENCTGLTQVTIPEGITTVGASAFYGCTGLTRITFPYGVTTIGSASLQKCTSLTVVTIPCSVTNIGTYAFSGCTKLTQVNYEGTSEQWNAITINNGNEKLTAATISYNYLIPHTHTFTNYISDNNATCTSNGTKTAKCDRCTQTNTLTEAGTALGHNFANYVSNNNATCTSDGTKTARCTRCTATSTLTDTGSALGHSFTNYTSNNDATCTTNSTQTARCNRCSTTNTLSVPGTALGHRVLTSGGVTTVDSYTTQNDSRYPFYLSGGWYGSTNKAHSSSSTYTIRAIYSCTMVIKYKVSSESNFDYLKIFLNGSSVDSISGSVSEKTRTFNLVAGDVITIQYSKDGSVNGGSDTGYFKIYSCTQTQIDTTVYAPANDFEPTCLDAVVCDVCHETVKPALGHSFTNYIPNNDATWEQNATQTAQCDRCEVTNTTEIPGTRLDYYAKGTCGDGLQWTMKVDGTLVISGTGAMYDYSYDTTTTETDIPWYEYRKEVTRISIGEKVTRIGKWAFRDFSNLTSLVIPNGVTEIGGNAFWICTGLQSVEIPASVQTIGTYAFYKCSNLTQVIIPEGVATLPAQVFYQCTKLAAINLPKTVTTIGNSTFRGCSALKDIYFSGTLEQWNAITVGTNNTPLTNATLHYHTHSFTNYIPNNDATYFEDGTKTAKCDTCDETHTIPDPGTMLPMPDGAILGHPQAITAASGENVQFRVEAVGGIVSYKWQYRKLYKWFDTSMTGYNTDTLTVNATGARNGYDYRCVITLADGNILYSEPAELTVDTVINIAKNPSDQTVVLGYKGQFTVTAEGEGLKYQWEYKRPDGDRWIETAMEGATKATVNIESTTSRNGYQYRCRITDASGKIVYTQPATMRVLSFTAHPETVFTAAGVSVTFSVNTSVTDGFTYQWQYSANGGAKWSNTTMTGYNTDTLTVNATIARNGYQYRCILTGSKSSKIESKAATLYVGNPVVITSQPRSVTTTASASAIFTVAASNVYSYQWYYSKNGTNWYATAATGNQTATLTVAASGKNGYMYRCKLIGFDGSEAYTDTATLTVR